ncbi:MAG TPA: asparaginase domain-containing protein [Candidatus Dormibacteraeota bacterium]|nr:asparaginase domain-containing protein [Candidatus Dormibacteraeota bacterium]
MTVRLITTGGTIATTSDKSSRHTKAALDSKAIAGLLDSGSGADVEVSEIALSPSWALTPADFAHIATTARDDARSGRYSGIVVTHGTSTLEYSAFMAELVNDTDVPVVFTGAMRYANDPDNDGPRNLADAVRVATSARMRGYRSLVVFAGLIIESRWAWKLKRNERDAFISTGGQAGHVGDTLEPPRRISMRPALDGRIDDAVALVKVYPGMDARILEAAASSGIHGLVIEALPGAGGVPPHLHQVVGEAAARIPVVIASRAPLGQVPSPPTGGTGEPFAAMHLISSRDLTSEKAWLLLMCVLGQSSSREGARELFESCAQP